MKKLSKVLALLLAVTVFGCSISFNTVEVEAKSKTTTYTLTLAQATTFTKSKGRLIIKAKKGNIFKGAHMTGKQLKATSKKKLSYKIAKNCKWQERDTGGGIHKITYKKLKKIYKAERAWYKKDPENALSSSPYQLTVVIKGNKVVKVYYLHA